jgi:hypothetical protein
MSETGLTLVLRHLIDLGAVAALLAACTATGLSALGRLRIRYDAPIESLIFGLTIGAGIIATALLALGLAGGLRAPIPEFTVVAFGAIAARQLRKLPLLVEGAWASLIGAGGRTRVALLAVSGAAAGFVLLLAIAPPADWDSLMYHLRVPAQFLARGRIFVPEDNLHVAFVGLPHMLYLPLLRLGSASAPAVLSAALTIALALSVFALASRFWGDACGIGSLLLFWSNPVVLLVGGTARIDVTCALLLLLAQYALLLALRPEGDSRQVYVGALLAGFALATKYHALLYAAALVPLGFVALRAHTTSAPQALGRLGLALMAAGAAAAPFLAKNLLLLGAAFYPFFAPLALEPWLAPVFHRTTVPPGAAAAAFQALAHVRQPFNLWDAFLHPGRLTVEGEGVFYHTSPLLLTLVLWPAFRRDRTLNWLGLPAAAYLVILLGVFPETNLRYLIPALAPLTVVAVVLAIRVGGRLLPRPAMVVGAPLLLVVALGPSLAAASAWLFGTRLVSHAVGLTSGDTFLETHFLGGISPHWQVVRFVNDSLPSKARVLELFDARGYFFRRAVLADPRLTNWPLLAQSPAAADCLRPLGITHVLVGNGSASYYVSRGLSREVLLLDDLDGFVARCLRPVFVAPGTTVYQVTRPSAEAARPATLSRPAAVGDQEPVPSRIESGPVAVDSAAKVRAPGRIRR